MKYYILSAFLLLQQCLPIEEPHNITTIFGRHIMHNKQQYETLQTLIEQCLQADQHVLYQAAELVIQKFQAQLHKLDQLIQEKKSAEKPADPRLFYEQFIIQQHIDYLKTYQQTLHPRLSWSKRLLQYIKKSFGYTDDQASMLAERIVEFSNHMINHYLLDYDKMLAFFAGIARHPLPDIINFWKDPQKRRQLQKRIATIKPDAKAQQWSFILEVGLQSLLLGAEGMYKQWLDEQAQEDFLALQKQMQKMGTDFQNFLSDLEKQQQETVIPAIIKSFKKGQQTIEDQYTAINKEQQTEFNYLMASINLDQPIQHYLMYPIVPWDQYFESGVMATPDNGYPWYNIFPNIQSGNLRWTFDAATNSFWQNALVTFGTPFWEDQVNGADPSANAIFTEYISKQASYQIEVDLNLINCSYPFFAGIMFNRAHWISADPERIWQYRLVGLYGTQSDPKDPTTRTIHLGFGQQVLQFKTDPQTGKQTEQIISPLEQISKQKNYLYSLAKDDIQMLDKEPLQFTLNIVTDIASVQITLSKKANNTTTQLYQTKLDNLDGYLTIFHGIGFMSPGCQTQFTIKKPEALVYTQQQLNDFNTTVSKMLAA